MKILLLGAAGFIGTNYVHRLSACQRKNIREDSVLVVDKLTYAGRLSNISKSLEENKWEFIEGDICNYELMAGLMEAYQPDVIINFAAESHVSRSVTDPASFTRTNVLGVQAVMESVRAKSPRSLTIHISTDEVFGQLSEWQPPWDDYATLNPRSPYAASKAAGEFIARSYFTTYGLDVIVVRPSNCFGRFQHPEKMIPRSITNLIDGNKIMLMGEGLQMRDWLYVDDLCDRLDAIIIPHGIPGECYNIPGHGTVRNRDIVKKILEYSHKDWNEDVEVIPHRLAHDFKYHVSGSGIKHLASENGLSCRGLSFTKNLNDTLSWYYANQDWWKLLKSDGELGNRNAHTGVKI